MAVAHDAVSESHTGTTGVASVTSFTWNHVPTGTPRSALVFTLAIGANPVTSVTYGGTSMTAVPYTAYDSDTEPGFVQAWFLDNCGSGTKAVVVNRTSNTVVTYAVCITQTASSACEVYAAGVKTRSGSGSEQTAASSSNTGVSSSWSTMALTDGSPGTNSVRYLAIHSGASSVSAASTNTTSLGTSASIDFGNYVFFTMRDTTPSQGSVTLTIASAISDDLAVIGLAVREMPPVVCTPGVVALTLTGLVPTISTPVVCTPGVVNLTTSLLVPTVTALSSYPAIRDYYESWSPDSSGTSFTVWLPETVVAGDLLVIAMDTSNSTTTTYTPPSGWAHVSGSPYVWDSSGGAFALVVMWKKATGDEGGTTVAVSYTPTDTYADHNAIAYAFYNASPVAPSAAFTRINGSTTSVDPPNLSTGTTSDWLWLALGARNAGSAGSAPSGYSGYIYNNAYTNSIEAAWKTGTGSSEDPGSFGVTDNYWGAATLGIQKLDSKVATPPVVNLTLTGLVPTVTAPALATPGVVALVTSLKVPTVTTPVLSTPPVVNLTTSLKVPTVTAPALATPGLVELTTSLKVPVLNTGLIPPTVALVTSLKVPSVTTPVLCTPPVVNLVITPLVPTVPISDNKIATPDLVALVTSLKVPSVTTPVLSTPGLVALTTSLKVPTVTAPALATPPVVNLTISLKVPVLDTGLIPPTVALVTSLKVPTVTAPALATPGLVALTTSLKVPTVSAPALSTPGLVALTMTTFAPVIATGVIPATVALVTSLKEPTVSTPRLCIPDTVVLVTDLKVPSIALPVVATPPTLSVVLASFVPDVSVVTANAIQPDTATLVTDLFAPTVTAPALSVPPTAALGLATFAPDVTTPVLSSPAPLGLTLTAFAPVAGVSDHKAATPPTAALLTALFAPTADLPVRATPSPVTLTLTLYPATVTKTDLATITPQTAVLTLTGGSARVRVKVRQKLVRVMDGLRDALVSAGYPNVYAFPPKSLTVPCTVVEYPDSIDFDVVFSRGADRFVMIVRFVVGRGTQKATRDALSAALLSVNNLQTALDGSYGWGTVRVSGSRVEPMDVNGIVYATGRVEVEVIA
jgi:hypothetical protein